MERVLVAQWSRGSAGTVAFSHYVARTTGASTWCRSQRPTRPWCAPPLVPPDQRRDLVVVGRLDEFENLDVLVWQGTPRGAAAVATTWR